MGQSDDMPGRLGKKYFICNFSFIQNRPDLGPDSGSRPDFEAGLTIM